MDRALVDSVSFRNARTADVNDARKGSQIDGLASGMPSCIFRHLPPVPVALSESWQPPGVSRHWHLWVHATC